MARPTPELRYLVAPDFDRVHGDPLGGLLTTRADGVLLARSLYRPFGGLVPGTEPEDASETPPTFGFTGQRSVPATGLYDYGARFYLPALGRFLQADTIVPEPGDPQSLNRYSYVRNNPLARVDPSGNADIYATSGPGNPFGFLWGAYALDGLTGLSYGPSDYLMAWSVSFQERAFEARAEGYDLGLLTSRDSTAFFDDFLGRSLTSGGYQLAALGAAFLFGGRGAPGPGRRGDRDRHRWCWRSVKAWGEGGY